MKRAPFLPVLVGLGLASAAGAVESLDDCLNAQDVTRVARVLDPEGRIVYARVVAQHEGHIRRAATIAPDGTPLAEVFEAARSASPDRDYAVEILVRVPARGFAGYAFEAP